MTPTSRLLELYVFARANAYMNVLDETPNYSTLNRYISLHLEAAGFANFIAERIRRSRAAFYRELAYKHCEAVTVPLHDLNRRLGKLCLDEALNAALLVAQSHREIAFSSNGIDRASHNERTREILGRVEGQLLKAGDPAIPIRYRWEKLFHQLLQDDPDDTVGTSVHVLMTDAYAIVTPLDYRRPEKAKQIRRLCRFNAERFGIMPDLKWRSPVKPIR